ncbi:hypothetical protein [Coleofasciculus sp. F4-SAH-05]
MDSRENRYGLLHKAKTFVDLAAILITSLKGGNKGKFGITPPYSPIP